jgi:hypothetical protein
MGRRALVAKVAAMSDAELREARTGDRALAEEAGMELSRRAVGRERDQRTKADMEAHKAQLAAQKAGRVRPPTRPEPQSRAEAERLVRTMSDEQLAPMFAMDAGPRGWGLVVDAGRRELRRRQGVRQSEVMQAAARARERQEAERIRRRGHPWLEERDRLVEEYQAVVDRRSQLAQDQSKEG